MCEACMPITNVFGCLCMCQCVYVCMRVCVCVCLCVFACLNLKYDITLQKVINGAYKIRITLVSICWIHFMLYCAFISL